MGWLISLTGYSASEDQAEYVKLSEQNYQDDDQDKGKRKDYKSKLKDGQDVRHDQDFNIVAEEDGGYICRVPRFKQFTPILFKLVVDYKLDILSITKHSGDKEIMFDISTTSNEVNVEIDNCKFINRILMDSNTFNLTYAVKIRNINSVIRYLDNKYGRENVMFYDFYETGKYINI